MRSGHCSQLPAFNATHEQQVTRVGQVLDHSVRQAVLYSLAHLSTYLLVCQASSAGLDVATAAGSARCMQHGAVLASAHAPV